MSQRRDYGRYRDWMGHALTAACLFLAVALLVAGHYGVGIFWGVVAVASALVNRR